MVDTMTSWFSVSDALTRVAVMVCVVCVTGGQLGAVQDSTYIPQCSARGWLEAREDQTAATYLTCEGFGQNQDVSWHLMKNGAVQASSTCGPLSTLPYGGQCDPSTSNIVVQRTSDTTTSLLISKNHRELVGNGSVRCFSDGVTNVDSCKINVITPAVLSDCEVTMTTHQTLAGACNFNNAYSSNGTYTCTWTLTPTDRQGNPNVSFPGVIHKTPYRESSKLYYKGTCSLNLTSSELSPGDYSYTVCFFPGDTDSQHQGTVTVTGSTYIPQCSAQGWLETREDKTAATFLTCKGYGPNQDVSWQLIKNTVVQASSTCGPLSTLQTGGQCDTTTSAIVVQRTSDTITSLLITHNRRRLVGNGSVRCLAEDVTNVGSCKINVITPAVLSDCEVTMTTNQTLAGTCNFNNAYSSNGTYTCTWTLIPTERQGDPNVIFPGVIHKIRYRVSGNLYYKGTCCLDLTSSELSTGGYSYNVHFFPGDSDSQHQGTVTVTETTTSNPDTVEDHDQSGVPPGALIGGLVAAVVVFSVIVAVLVIWRKGWTKKSTELKIPGHDFDKCRSNGSQQCTDVQLNEKNCDAVVNDNETVGQPAPSTPHGQGSQLYIPVPQNEENSDTGLNNETVGQPAPSTSHGQDGRLYKYIVRIRRAAGEWWVRNKTPTTKSMLV